PPQRHHASPPSTKPRKTTPPPMLSANTSDLLRAFSFDWPFPLPDLFFSRRAGHSAARSSSSAGSSSTTGSAGTRHSSWHLGQSTCLRGDGWVVRNVLLQGGQSMLMGMASLPRKKRPSRTVVVAVFHTPHATPRLARTFLISRAGHCSAAHFAVGRSRQLSR